MTRTHGHRAQHVLLALGVLYVLLALLLNEWTIAALVGVDHLLPVSRQVIRALGLAGITWGVLTIAYRRRPLLANLNVSLIAGLLLLLSIEGVVHAFPSLFGRGFANGVLSKYSTNPGGIYYTDPVVRLDFMLPSYGTRMFYNGYRWHHQTDQHGFRNQGNRTAADIVLLGDSQAYGHGLEIDETIGSVLERMTGRTVYNLGRQGNSSLQGAYVLTDQIARLRPRVVLYLFTDNDIRDLYVQRTDEELERFIETPIAAISYPSKLNLEAALRLREAHNAPNSLMAMAGRWSYLVNLYRSRQVIRSQWALETRIGDQKHDEKNPESLGWRYTKHAIAYMNNLAVRNHATFVVVPNPAFDQRMTTILEGVAAAEAIPFVDTSSLDRTGPSNASLYLHRDGHFSVSGVQAMAAVIAEYLVKNPGLFSGGPPCPPDSEFCRQ